MGLVPSMVTVSLGRVGVSEVGSAFLLAVPFEGGAIAVAILLVMFSYFLYKAERETILRRMLQ